METRPSIVVDLTEYGMTGEIRMEPLTLRREIELKNNLGRCNHYSGSGDDLKLDYTETGSAFVYAVMAHITDAPFQFKNFDGFMNYMDKVEAKGVGNSSKLFARLKSEADRIQRGELSPFAGSDSTPTGNSESS